MRIIEIKTTQTSAIKTLIESLKDILTDTNFICDERGLRLSAMDSTQTILISLKLEADRFDRYECRKKMPFGVNIPNLYKCIKSATNADILTLYIDDMDENILGIRIENSEKNLVTEDQLNLIEAEELINEIQSNEFQSYITIPSTDFQKICRDMNNFSKTIEIKCIGQQLTFSCKGDTSTRTTTIGTSNNGVTFERTSDTQDIIQGYYNLAHLVLFTKCTGLCTVIKMYLQNNFPIIIEYSVGNLGELKLALAPKVNNDAF